MTSEAPGRPGMLRRLVLANMALSMRFDNLLAESWRVDGMQTFVHSVVPQSLQPGAIVADLGSGKMPAIARVDKVRLGLHVTGVDIDPVELRRAPAGIYDEMVVADLTRWSGEATADVVICSAVLEHVQDTEAAMAAIASALRPGGRALIFCPCRNAAFARINLLLGERLKVRLLDLLYGPGHGVGFPAYYNRCTPGKFAAMARAAGLRVNAVSPFYMSTYFMVFTPMHVVWRALQGLAVAIAGSEACESFVIVASKDGDVVGDNAECHGDGEASALLSNG